MDRCQNSDAWMEQRDKKKNGRDEGRWMGNGADSCKGTETKSGKLEQKIERNTLR